MRAALPRHVGFAILASLVGLFFLPVVLGESFFGRDVTPFFYPMKKMVAESVLRLDLPLWNPWVAGGEPFFATLQPAVLYPGSLPLYLLPFPLGADWTIILHFLFAAFGWFLLLRRTGNSNLAALLGATVFTLGGFFVSLGNFMNNLQTAAWAPWLFLAWLGFLDAPTRHRLVLFAAACVAAFLGGEPQLLALVLATVFLWGLVRQGEAPGRSRQLAGFAIAGVLALMVAGVQLLPFVEFVGQSVRTLPLSMEFTASRSQDWPGLFHLLVPPALGEAEVGFSTQWLAHREVPWLLSLYPGAVVLPLVFFGFGRVPRREAWLWAVLGLLGLLLALGVHSPAYRLSFAGLPPIRAFRYPEKFAFLAALGLPFLAAAGFDRWLRGEDRSRFVVGYVVLTAFYLVVAALVARPGLLGSLCASIESRWCADPSAAGVLYRSRALVLAGFLAAATLATVIQEKRARRVVGGLVLALVSADLVLAHRAVNPTAGRSVYTDPPWAAQILERQAAMRPDIRVRSTPVTAAMGEAARLPGAEDLSNLYLDVQALGPNQGQQWGFLQQDGLQGVEMRSVAMTHDAAMQGWGDPLRFLRLSNVAYYLDPTTTADSIEGLRELRRHEDLPIRLFEVPDPLPRAFVADGWEPAEGPAQALQRALDPDVPLRRAIVEGTVQRAPRKPTGSRGRIVAATWEAERVRLIARVLEPSVLVLLDRWYPGWQVTVDGVSRPVLRANGVYRAVEVPAGEIDVEFRFRPVSLRQGALLSVMGLLVCAALLWRRPGGNPEAT